jgi:hypothetical protein
VDGENVLPFAEMSFEQLRSQVPVVVGGRTLIPKNAFSWRVPHPMVLRVRVLTFFQPGAPGRGWAMGRKHSGVKPLLHTAYRNHGFVATFEVACLMDTWVAETMPISTRRLAARALALLSRTSSLDLPKPFVLIRL